MGLVNLGQVAFVDSGVFNIATTYKKWDFVTTEDSTYLYIGEAASAGHAVTDIAFWKCLADGKPATLAAAAANLAALSVNSGGGTTTPIYLSNVASAVAGYKKLSYEPDGSEVTKTIVANNNTVTGEAYLFDLPIDIDVFPAGQIDLAAFVGVSSLASNSYMVVDYFLYLTDGTETLIRTATSPSIENTALEYIQIPAINTTGVAVPIGARFGMRVKFQTTRNSNTTFSYVVGDGRAAWFRLPIAMSHKSLRRKNEEADFQHLTATQVGLVDSTVAPTLTPLADVANFAALPTGVYGDARKVTSENVIYSHNGVGWKSTGQVEFPADIATKDELKSIKNFEILDITNATDKLSLTDNVLTALQIDSKTFSPFFLDENIREVTFELKDMTWLALGGNESTYVMLAVNGANAGKLYSVVNNSVSYNDIINGLVPINVGDILSVVTKENGSIFEIYVKRTGGSGFSLWTSISKSSYNSIAAWTNSAIGFIRVEGEGNNLVKFFSEVIGISGITSRLSNLQNKLINDAVDKTDIVAPVLNQLLDVTSVEDLKTEYPTANYGDSSKVISDGMIRSFNGFKWLKTGLKFFQSGVKTYMSSNPTINAYLKEFYIKSSFEISKVKVINFWKNWDGQQKLFFQGEITYADNSVVEFRYYELISTAITELVISPTATNATVYAVVDIESLPDGQIFTTVNNLLDVDLTLSLTNFPIIIDFFKPHKKFLPKPASGIVHFSVNVNVFDANTLATSVHNQDAAPSNSLYRGTDAGVLILPTNYNHIGAGVPLIIDCHGSGSSVGGGTVSTTHSDFLKTQGFAVMDMACLPSNKLMIGKGINESHFYLHLGNYTVVQCLLKGIDHVVKNYNIDCNNIFCMGYSLGGLAATQLAMSNCVNIKAQALKSPVLDICRQGFMLPWNGWDGVGGGQFYDVQKDWVQRLFNFGGTVPTFTNERGLSNDEKAFLVANVEKLIGYNPMWKWTNGLDFSAAAGCVSVVLEKEQSEIDLYSNAKLNYPVPLKIWHCVDDYIVFHKNSLFFIEMCRRAGSMAFLRTVESGNHWWTTIDTVQVPTIDGGTVTTTIVEYEISEYFKRFVES